jgi:hypothetical protein
MYLSLTRNELLLSEMTLEKATLVLIQSLILLSEAKWAKKGGKVSHSYID